MGLTAHDFLEEMVMEKINQIPYRDLKGIRILYKEQGVIMKSLGQETRDKSEEFASNMLCISAEECMAVYKDMFLDGLCLGYRVFR